MAKRPEDRFSTAGEMAEALRGGPVAPRRPRRRGALIGLGAGAAFLALGIVVLASRNDETATPNSSAQTPTIGPVPLDSLLPIDPETGEVLSNTADLPTASDQHPQVEIDESGVWVLAGVNVVHVEPTDGTIVGTVTLGGGGFQSTSMAVGYRTVWVGSYPGIVRIDPISDQTLRPVRLSAPSNTGSPGGTVGVAVGAGSAWGVTSDGRLIRVDPHTGAKTGIADVTQSAAGVATGFDSVWVTDDLGGTLTRVDPETLEGDAPFPVPGELDAIAVGAGAVWILDMTAGVVTPIDPATSPPTAGSPIRVGAGPTDIAVGLDAVWVANNADETISNIDP